MATYCSECGTMLQEGEAVCRRCGTPVGGQSPQQTPTQDDGQSSVQPYQQLSIQPQQQMPIQNSPTYQQVGNASLFSDLKPYYREEFTKIYESNGKYNGRFNVKAFLAWGPWYLMHIGGGKGIRMLICWMVLICCIPLALTGAIGLLLVGILAGSNGTKQYYSTYMKRYGL